MKTNRIMSAILTLAVGFVSITSCSEKDDETIKGAVALDVNSGDGTDTSRSDSHRRQRRYRYSARNSRAARWNSRTVQCDSGCPDMVSCLGRGLHTDGGH